MYPAMRWGMIKRLSIRDHEYQQLHLVYEDGVHEQGYSLAEFTVSVNSSGEEIYRFYMFDCISNGGGFELNNSGIVITENEP
jgi:hypothetical protein